MKNETLSKQVWNRFVQDGVMESTRINNRITESWYLCRQSNVNPYSGVGREILTGDSLRRQKERNQRLLDLSAPYLERLVPFVRDESELFGYAEGAFTGARRGGYKGKLEQANGGTLFLDEIGEIPSTMQIALLRVLQERRVTPVGGSKEISLDIRVIAATHRDLRKLVREGTFRQDLFYRLYVLTVSVPPLRARKEDIPTLIRYFCQKNKWKTPLPSTVVEYLLGYDWPGNIRELFNVLERLSIVPPEEMELRVKEMLAGEYELEQRSFSPSPKAVADALVDSRIPADLTFRDQLERQSIMHALMKTGGSASRAASLLGMPRSTFYRKLRKYQL